MDDDVLASAAAKGEITDAGGASVPSSLIVQLLDGSENATWPKARRAIRLSNAMIIGRVELQSLECACPLELLNCQIADGIDARSASIRWLDLSGSTVGDLQAANVAIDRRLVLDDGFRSEGPVVLNGASIGRSLSATGARFLHRGKDAFDLTDAVIEGSVDLQRIWSVGLVRLEGAKAGSLELNGATLSAAGTSPGEVAEALDARNIAIAGDVTMGDGFKSLGLVRLANATIGGRLRATGCQIWANNGRALDGDHMTVAGSTLFDQGSLIEGEVALTAAHIGGDLEFTNSNLRSSAGRTIRGLGVRVDGTVRCNQIQGPGFTSVGQIQFDNATIKGDLDCSGGRFEQRTKVIELDPHVRGVERPAAPVSLLGAQISGSFDASGSTIKGARGVAVDANGASVGQSFCLETADVEGTVVLTGAIIAQQLNCRGADIRHINMAIQADGVKVGTDLLLCCVSDRPFTARGCVNLVEASVGADLLCRGGRFECETDMAIDARGITVGAESWLDTDPNQDLGFVAIGEVRFARAKLTGQLTCTGATFEKAGQKSTIAFDGTGMNIGTRLVWKRLKAPPVGRVLFDNASVGLLDDDASSWPESSDSSQLSINGFSYSGLAPEAFDGVSDRLGWIRRGPYSLQPYQQLRILYANCGRPKDARTVAIAKENDRRRKTNQLKRFSLVGHQVSRAVVGYGYQPLRAAFWLVGLVILAALTFGFANHEGVMFPTQATGADQVVVRSHCTGTYPCFNAAAYGFDVVVPIINLGQRENWSPDWHHAHGPPFVYAEWVFTILGWFVVTMAVAGLTGWLSPDPKTG